MVDHYYENISKYILAPYALQSPKPWVYDANNLSMTLEIDSFMIECIVCPSTNSIDIAIRCPFLKVEHWVLYLNREYSQRQLYLMIDNEIQGIFRTIEERIILLQKVVNAHKDIERTIDNKIW